MSEPISVRIDVKNDDRFERQTGARKVFTDTGIRMRVGDTVLAGTDDEFLVSEFVVTPSETPSPDGQSKYRFTRPRTGGGSNLRATKQCESRLSPRKRHCRSSGGRSPKSSYEPRSASSRIYNTNPQLEDHAQIKELRDSVAEARKILDGNA